MTKEHDRKYGGLYSRMSRKLMYNISKSIYILFNKTVSANSNDKIG